MAGIPLGSGFGRTSAQPLDLFSQVEDLSARDAIPSGVRYLGMVVFVVSELMEYTLKTGLTDGDWEEAGGGGGVGGMIPHYVADVDAPLFMIRNGAECWQFDAAQGQKLFVNFKVPNGYRGAKQVFMRSQFESEDTSATNVLFKTTVTLIRPLTDLITSTTNQHVSTNTAKVQGPTIAGKVQVVVNDLTTFHGQINSEPLIPGDFIKMVIERDAADTSTLPVFFYPKTSEITFG